MNFKNIQYNEQNLVILFTMTDKLKAFQWAVKPIEANAVMMGAVREQASARGIQYRYYRFKCATSQPGDGNASDRQASSIQRISILLYGIFKHKRFSGG